MFAKFYGEWLEACFLVSNSI